MNPVRDRKYLDHLREGPCIVTGDRGHPDAPVCEPAHLRLLGSGGVGMKPSDALAVPLHWRLHRQGETTAAFWRRIVDEYPDFLPRLLLEVASSRYREWKRKNAKDAG